MDPDPDQDPPIFVNELQDDSKKQILLYNFLCLFIFEATFTSFFKE